MNQTVYFPLTILLALAAVVIWTIGNRRGKKVYVWIGVALTVAALFTYVMGI